MKLNFHAAKNSETKPKKVLKIKGGGIFNSVTHFFKTKTFIFSSIIVASMLCLLFIQSCNETPIQGEELEQEENPVLPPGTIIISDASYKKESDSDNQAVSAELRKTIQEWQSGRSCIADCTYNVFDCGMTNLGTTGHTLYLTNAAGQGANLFCSFQLAKAASGGTGYYQIVNLSISKYGTGSLHIQKAFNIGLAGSSTIYNKHRNFYDELVIYEIHNALIKPHYVSNNYSGFGNLVANINKYCYAQCGSNWVSCGQGCCTQMAWFLEDGSDYFYITPTGSNGSCSFQYPGSQYCPSNPSTPCFTNDCEADILPN